MEKIYIRPASPTEKEKKPCTKTKKVGKYIKKAKTK
jgi:hypothetical protein